MQDMVNVTFLHKQEMSDKSKTNKQILVFWKRFKGPRQILVLWKRFEVPMQMLVFWKRFKVPKNTLNK